MPLADHQHPKRTLSEENGFEPNPPAPFVELGLMTCFSFLRGASDAVDLVTTAWSLGYDALGVADRNSLAGVVRVHAEARTAKLRPVIGSRLVLVTGEELLAYPRDRAAYGRLCRLLSKGKMQDAEGGWQAKGACDLTLDDLAAHAEGIELILLPPRNPGGGLEGLPQRLRALRARLPGLGHVAASCLYRGDDRARINALHHMARREGLGLLATNDVLYHEPQRRPLQDVMACIREGVRLADAGFLLEPSAERHLKGPGEMVRLFREWPHAVAAARKVADACTFSLGELRHAFPQRAVPPGADPQAHLERLTWKGAAARYPAGPPPKVEGSLRKELALIGRMRLATYFLTIHEVVSFARSRGILCQGRGSAANSAVCFVLGITAVDPELHDLLFERFLTEERQEPPDIDVDFEHERREEVIQHIYAKYGRDRAGLCATVIHYRPRSAIREVGKALGLSDDVTGALAKSVWGSWGTEVGETHVAEAGLDLSDPVLRMAVRLASQLVGMPRHLSQHVGGFVLTEEPLVEVVPIGNGAMPERSFIEWDKDDIDALGLYKMDVLGLGMLTAIRRAFDLLAGSGGPILDLASIPQGDEATYAMLRRADSIGVFQVESRAQMAMLPKLRPATFYDLVIEVAIVRPGPIQGGMVHPYLRRRMGREEDDTPGPGPEHGPSDELTSILGRTRGVPIFQEQAMKIAMVAAKFTPAELNRLRRAMATFRHSGTIHTLEARMVEKMIERGYEPGFARRCFDQIKGFGEYGFPESHAASFAHLVYASAWLKCHHPAAFGAALLNSQPMGFYAPAQIVRDMSEHGVEVRPPDVNHSEWDTTLVPDGRGDGRGDGRRGMAVRLGLRVIDGLPRAAMERFVARREGPFRTVEDLQRRGGLTAALIRRLAEADALGSLLLDRRQALWQTRGLKEADDLPLFEGTPDEGIEPVVPLPSMPLSEEVVADYQTLRLSLKAHPMAFLRRSLRRQGFATAASLAHAPQWGRVRLAGLVLIRQRPGSAKGVCFVTLEDETGVANLVVWPKVMEAHRKVVMQARLLVVQGQVQSDGEVVHVVAESLEDRSDALGHLAPDGLAPPMSRADEVNRPVQGSARGSDHPHPRDSRLLPKSRDFH